MASTAAAQVVAPRPADESPSPVGAATQRSEKPPVRPASRSVTVTTVSVRARPLRTNPPQDASTDASRPDLRRRALAIWPGLDRDKLRRTRGELQRIARLVEKRTALSFETILRMLSEHRD